MINALKQLRMGIVNKGFSLYNSGSTASIVCKRGTVILGVKVNKLTSYTNTPLVSMQVAGSLIVSAQGSVVGTDVCEGVVICLEP